MQKYIRLLSYDNAMKVIEFIRTSINDGDAYITTGGISMDVRKNDLPKVEKFIKSLDIRYEIGNIPPFKVNQQIIKDLKEDGIIQSKTKHGK